MTHIYRTDMNPQNLQVQKITFSKIISNVYNGNLYAKLMTFKSVLLAREEHTSVWLSDLALDWYLQFQPNKSSSLLYHPRHGISSHFCLRVLLYQFPQGVYKGFQYHLSSSHGYLKWKQKIYTINCLLGLTVDGLKIVIPIEYKCCTYCTWVMQSIDGSFCKLFENLALGRPWTSVIKKTYNFLTISRMKLNWFLIGDVKKNWLVKQTWTHKT